MQTAPDSSGDRVPVERAGQDRQTHGGQVLPHSLRGA